MHFRVTCVFAYDCVDFVGFFITRSTRCSFFKCQSTEHILKYRRTFLDGWVTKSLIPKFFQKAVKYSLFEVFSKFWEGLQKSVTLIVITSSTLTLVMSVHLPIHTTFDVLQMIQSSKYTQKLQPDLSTPPF